MDGNPALFMAMIASGSRVLDHVAGQQDYVWFCAALGWLAAAGLLRLQRAALREILGLATALPLVVAGGLAITIGAMIMHATPPDPLSQLRLGWDRWLSGASLLQTFAFLPLLYNRSLVRRVLLGLAGLALVGTWSLRLAVPVPANGALALAPLALTLAAARQLRPGLSWPQTGHLLAAGILVALATLVSTTGLVAELTAQQAHSSELSLLGPFSGLLQLFAAGSLILSLNPRALLGLREGGTLWTPSRGELRQLLAVLGAWLLFGFFMSWWTGQVARTSYEQNLLARVRAAAVLIDPAHVLPVVGPGFRLTEHTVMLQPNGRGNPVARAPYLAEVYRATAEDLNRIEDANPDSQWSHFTTFRDGYVVSCVFAAHLKLQRDWVAVHRRITDDDLRAWQERRLYLEGPEVGPWGEQVRVYAPIVDPVAGMLGWVGLDFGASDWAAAQALPRLQTFAVIGAGVLILGLFLVQRVRTQQAVHIAQEAAMAQAADRAKTAFLAKVSHELRTPVQSILGYGELLAGMPLTSDSGRWLGAIRNQGQLLIRLVNDLLDLSAIQAGAFRLLPRPTNLTQLVRSCVDSLRPRAQAKSLELSCEIDPETPTWLALDPERVRQVLFNLVGNAIKFTDTGNVDVALRVLPASAPDLPVVRVELTVRDTGSGIPLDQQASLFRPFTRLRQHADREGAGLGLALTTALCSSMGGSLRVSSDGVKGTAFVAELALALASAPALAPPSTATSLQGKRVLVADDNALVRELYATTLRAAGAWCETAPDGLDAVERCTTERFDVVVLDISMPWLDGMESARRIRGLAQTGLRIVGVSAHAGAAEREQALAAGMDVFLVKPVALGELIAVAAGASQPASPRDPGADLVLLRRLRAQFAEEARQHIGELRQAVAGDRQWLAARIHHLKNSADVTGLVELSLLCGRIQELARSSDAGVRPELNRLVDEVIRQLQQVAVRESLSPDLPGDH